MRIFIIIATFLMLVANTVCAQEEQRQQQPAAKDQQKTYLYQWIDDKGIAHVTDNLGNVPTKYRKKVLMLEQSPTEQEPAQVQPRVTAPSRADESANEGYAKTEWQQRMKDARVRLADAERRYQELEKNRLEALGKWGGVASGRLEGRMEAEQIAEQMKQVQKEIDDARNQIENVIPEEARKAGVPPGWLRE